MLAISIVLFVLFIVFVIGGNIIRVEDCESGSPLGSICIALSICFLASSVLGFSYYLDDVSDYDVCDVEKVEVVNFPEVQQVQVVEFKYCPNCGQAAEDYNFCPNCGGEL